MSHVQRTPAKYLKPKKSLNIATFNIRTGKEDWKIKELACLMDLYGISVIAIQEHRRIHKEELLYEHMDDHLLVTASVWRNSAQAAVGGVGFLINKKSEAALCEINKISDRIVRATFAGNPECTLIAAYVPTNCKQQEKDTEEFYENLRTAIDQIPSHNLLAILGDMNAKLSSAHVRYAFDKRTNENGLQLLELACEKSLIFRRNLEKGGRFRTQNRIDTN